MNNKDLIIFRRVLFAFLLVATLFLTGCSHDAGGGPPPPPPAGGPPLPEHPPFVFPEKSQAVVYLNFEGGSDIKISILQPDYIKPFDVSDIDGRLDGYTDEIIEIIYQRTKEVYAPYNVDVYSSHIDTVPVGPHHTIYFGWYMPCCIGLADSVDLFDSKKTQNAIVFTESFELFNKYNPTYQELANEMSNSVVHEIGHLLGLVHTQNKNDVMFASYEKKLEDIRPSFALLNHARSPVHQIFMCMSNNNVYQNSPKQLEAAVGLKP